MDVRPARRIALLRNPLTTIMESLQDSKHDPPSAAGPPLVELCVASAADAVHGRDLNVDRLELNCGLPLGGLTPTTALLREVREVFPGPVVCMVRPRPGGFCYSSTEFRLMCREAGELLENGAAGIAIGFLTSDAEVDDQRCAEFRGLFADAVLVFHRAADICYDPVAAARTIADCGFQRILTSGGAVSASDGVATLSAMTAAVGDVVEIIAAGGIRAGNVRDVVTGAGVRAVHSAASTTVTESRNSVPARTPFAAVAGWNSHVAVDRETLRQLIDAIITLRERPT